MIERAGGFTQTQGALFTGFFEGRPIWYDGAGGCILVAGARGGKLRDWLAYNVCAGICRHTQVILDPKCELAPISQNQIADEKFNLYWNPAHLNAMPTHSINPLEHLTPGNPLLESDIQRFAENTIVQSGATNGIYFEQRARQFLFALCRTAVDVHGPLTLPLVRSVVSGLISESAEWFEFAGHMRRSDNKDVRAAEAEIFAARENPSNNFQGILGELSNAFACLSDPVLLRSVSPPFSAKLSDITKGQRAYNLYLTPPAEFLGQWSMVIKAILLALRTFKSRAPSAPRQTWLLDECALLGKFPLLTEAFTVGAGIGIRPVAIFQSVQQMRAVGQNAEHIIPSSAALQVHFAVRDIASAQAMSHQLGSQTLEYDDTHRQAQARHAGRRALQALIGGGDFLQSALEYKHQRRISRMRSKQHRHLRTPDEILHTPPGKMYVQMDGVPKPIYADRFPYYTQPMMAGRYLPNPYHPPSDRVQIATQNGIEWRRAITEPVPAQLAHYPQYTSGMWSYAEGFRPNV
jgi:type IV secretion system protein VirD4